MGYGTRHLQHVTSQYMFFQYMFVWLIVQPCRFQLAAMLEMPEDSAPFKTVEQSMEKQGLADTNWDETDPVQKAYSLAKRERVGPFQGACHLHLHQLQQQMGRKLGSKQRGQQQSTAGQFVQHAGRLNQQQQHASSGRSELKC